MNPDSPPKGSRQKWASGLVVGRGADGGGPLPSPTLSGRLCPSGTCRWPPAPRRRQLVPSELLTLQRQLPREALAPTVSTHGPAGQCPMCCLWGWRRWGVQSHGKGGLRSRALQSPCHWMGPGCQGREHPARPELVSGLSRARPALPAGAALGGAGSKERGFWVLPEPQGHGCLCF